MMHGVPCITTLTGAAAAVNAIRAMHTEGLTVRALQEYHAEIATKKGVAAAQFLRAAPFSPRRNRAVNRAFPLLHERASCARLPSSSPSP